VKCLCHKHWCPPSSLRGFACALTLPSTETHLANCSHAHARASVPVPLSPRLPPAVCPPTPAYLLPIVFIIILILATPSPSILLVVLIAFSIVIVIMPLAPHHRPPPRHDPRPPPLPSRYTRLTRSGLSMTEWKLSGSKLPSTVDEWTVEFDKYKKTPGAADPATPRDQFGSFSS
jgi:hypothetical protein